MLEYVQRPRLVHEGPHSLVFRAFLPGGKPVLVKMAREEHPPPRRLAAARREYDLLSVIHSPAVVRPLGLRADGHRLALLLEDFGGRSLDALVEPGAPLPLDRFFPLALDLAEGLAGVHAAGIIHLDVQPSNVVAHPETWRAKLIDFNLSSVLSRQTRPAVPPRGLVGSLPYLSPEQTGRVNRPVDLRSDLYSLGVTLYELLCGQLPFTASSAVELVHCHLARRPVPPAELRPDCPPVLSHILDVLLAKSADDRYQSATGLRADLQRARDAWSGAGPVTFALRGDDVPQRFVLSERLYGREAEEDALLQAFERVAAGRCELLLVEGASGIGKSAIIREARRSLAGREGFFIEGKFDQYRRNVPYDSLVQALRHLVLQLLAEEPSALAAWRSAVEDAVGGNGQILVDVIPELELLLGPQLALALLPPGAALNRFGLVLGAFISVFARPEHPLVLFLDDLQWADAASLKLLQLLTTDAKRRGLLVVGACRDDEAAARHRLSDAVNAITTAGGHVVRLSLGPLDVEAVGAWIRDSFGGSTADAQRRAAHLVAKTGGNPFFLTRFLASLHEDGLLVPDPEGWRWHDAALAERDFTPNVIELVTQKLRMLPDPARELLQIAACLGASLSLRSLAVAADRPVLEAGRALDPAVVLGFLLPLDSDYRLLAAWDEAEAGAVPDDFDCTLRFLHDRVQQAAYGTIPEARRAAIHLLVGRRLLDALPPDRLDDRLFEIVDHLNAAAGSMDEPGELARLAELDLRAGRRARQSGAYGPACNLLDTALALLPRIRGARPDLERDLRLERGISRAQTGRGAEAAEDFEAALAQSPSPAARVDVRLEWIQGLLYEADYLGVLEQGVAALLELGVELPDGVEARQAVGLALLETTTADLEPEAIRALEGLPVIDDPVAERIAGLLCAISPSAHMTDESEHWFMWVAFRGLQLFREHGNTAASAHGYSLVGMTLCAMGQVERGYAFHRLAVAVAERFDDPVQLGRTTACLGFHQALRDSHRSAAETGRRAWRFALEAGDWFHAQWAAVTILRSALHSGDSLPRLREDAERCGDFLERRGPEMAGLCRPMVQLVEHLDGRAGLSSPYAAPDAAWFEEVEPLENEALRVWTQSVGLLALLLDGRVSQVCELARRIWPRYLTFDTWGDGGELHFIHGLAAAAVARQTDASPDEAEEQLAQLRSWSAASPAAYGAKAELLGAAVAEARGQLEEALDGCLRAGEQARAEGINHVEALAALGAARVQQARARHRYANLHRLDARQAWMRWGASRLAEGIGLDLDGGALRARERAPLIPWWASDGSGSAGGPAVDLETVLRAADAISSKIDEDQLLRRVLQLAAENAGADVGALVLRSERGMRVRARWIGGSTGTDRFEAVDLALEEASFLSIRVVHYVLRTGEPVVVDRVQDDPRFARDPHLLEAGVQSMLAVPLRRGGVSAAVLVLENRLTPAAFSRERVQLLTTLSSHMAIALDNARLVAELQRVRDEAVARGEDLAGEVHSRGLALAEAQQLQGAVLDALSEGVCGLGADGRVLLANPAALSLLGASPDDLLGTAFHATFHPEAAADHAPLGSEATCALCDAPASLPPAEARFRRADASILVVECAVRRMAEAPGGVVRVLSFRDVGRRKELEEQLLRSRKIEAVGQFVAGVAHEFNNLLTPLLGHLAWLRDDEDPSGPRGQALADMESASHRAAALVQQLLAFGRRSSLFQAPVELVSVVVEVVRFLAPTLPPRIELSFEPPPEDHWVLGDVQQVHQVLHNLCANACDALDSVGPKGSGRGSIRVSLVPRTFSEAAALTAGDGARPGRFVELLVADDGPGIAEEAREHLFEPFFTTKPLGRGTGLGLAVVLGIVQQHGGWVTVRPAAEGGSEFRVFLPQVEAPEGGLASITSGSVEAPRRQTILIVDDEPVVRRVAATILERSGFQALQAPDGATGLAFLADRGDGIDLVLLDLSMPVMDGWETLAALRGEGFGVPVLLTSGFNLGQSDPDSLDRGAQGFLPKPFNGAQLLEAVNSVLLLASEAPPSDDGPR